LTRGHPPTVAIGEAQRQAASMGCPVLAMSTGGTILPFDFVIYDQGSISLVRVRRLRYAGYDIADIEVSCRKEIEALRAVTVGPEISRQLHVRGPDRHWHRYLVLPDSIEEIGKEVGH
jgi:hypothetical protein